MFLLEAELGATAIAIACAFAWPGSASAWFARLEKLFAQLARRKALAVIVTGVTVVLLRLAILPWFPVPFPFTNDDFSFLLAADTFAHGRLANPTPVMWTHFESIHISMQPTYQSMYFPGQGLVLAAGKVMFGNPWIALLILSGVFCATLCWMLQAWLPPNWALLGGLLAVVRLGLLSVWINTYSTGGSIAALGGLLVLGSLPRLLRTAQMRYALLMGLGISILVLTRPYEGLLLCLPTAVALFRWIFTGKNRPPAAVLVRLVAPSLALVFTALAWLAYYDYKAFGKATTLPYTINRSTYAMAPYYIWQSPRPEPSYRHAAIRIFYEKELSDFEQIHSLAGFVPRTLYKVVFVFFFYAGFALLPPLIMVRRAFLDRRIRFIVACLLVLAAGMLVESFLLPYYLAPFTGAFYGIGLQMMRHLRRWRPERRPVGLAIVRLTVAVCFLMAALRIAAEPLGLASIYREPLGWNFTWIGPEHFGGERAQIESQLHQLPGGQLVIVRYSPHHKLTGDWVYNPADIDHAKVIWARDMGAAENSDLIRYYRDRTVWLVEPDSNPIRVMPYPLTAAGAAARLSGSR
jgi:hypothetical protein